MIAYRQQRTSVPTADMLQRIRNSSGLERQMEFGLLESGVADALCPFRDEDHPILEVLRRGSLEGLALPDTIEVAVPEGFAYYALDPELYRIAARRFVAELNPTRVAVIGIRTIGTTLSSIVEAELRRLGVFTRSWTVRPHGHPWNRELEVSPELELTWRDWDGWFAIVDEGPGLSGSSFAAVADFLAYERTVLFPSSVPDGSGFVSTEAREVWQRYPKYCAAFEELERFDDAIDLSGGQWRDLLNSWPPVQPQHERRKYLRDGMLFKFAGFGRFGRTAVERAQRLAGWVPQPVALDHGFLVTPWMEGREPDLDTSLVDHAARYIATVAREFATGAPADAAALAHMIENNLDREWIGPVPDGKAATLDARMFPHEWCATGHGILKLDALDHGDDHFYPGPQDPAWDLAAFAIEWDLDTNGQGYLVERYARASGDHDAAPRIPFYRAAYLAFRIGYADLAVRALGDSPDGRRFHRERARYESILRREPWIAHRTSRLSA